MATNSAKNKVINVLLIDDDEDDYLIIKRVFARIPDSAFALSWCNDYVAAKKAINSKKYDIFLIDYRLGAHTGLELLEYAAPHKRAEPFILLTGVGDKNVEKQSMKLAAADYLVKGTFNADLLSRTLYYSLERKQVEAQRLQHLIDLNRAKDEFISLASHQLRTPATGVKQYLGMVLEGFVGDLSEPQQKILKKAQESNERQLSIVSDLLKVAQVDAGKVRLRKSNVDMITLIKDVLKEQHATFEQRHQKIVFEPGQSDIVVCVDRDTIRMVLENLIDNASKYSGEGKTVTVKIKDAAMSIEISVIDQGVGIKMQDQSKLFEKFSRIDNPLSTLVGGTGLGLYWAKKIIDLHRGNISFESKAGKGTAFTVHLPKVHAKAVSSTTQG